MLPPSLGRGFAFPDLTDEIEWNLNPWHRLFTKDEKSPAEKADEGVSTFYLTKNFFDKTLDFSVNPVRIGVSNQGETEVAQEGGFMAKVISRTAPEVAKATPKVVKVSRKVVELISELSEVRATYNSAKARVEELRDEVLSQVGRSNLTLVHNSIEVARIVESSPVRVDEEFLKENYPEAYQASLRAKPQHTIRSVTRKAN